MKKDVETLEVLKTLSEIKIEEDPSVVIDHGGTLVVGFETTASGYAVVVNTVGSETFIISRNNADESEHYPNGIIFMDGYWFGVDKDEHQTVIRTIGDYVMDLVSVRLNRKLDTLKEKQLIPATIDLL